MSRPVVICESCHHLPASLRASAFTVRHSISTFIHQLQGVFQARTGDPIKLIVFETEKYATRACSLV